MWSVHIWWTRKISWIKLTGWGQNGMDFKFKVHIMKNGDQFVFWVGEQIIKNECDVINLFMISSYKYLFSGMILKKEVGKMGN